MQARIRHLDGMRGLAILLVIGYHAYSRWPDILHFTSITKNFPLFKFGYIGVPLFFMISGFVIFMTLDKTRSYWLFLQKRWLRLFPAMLIVSLIVYFTAGFFSERPGGIPDPLNLVPGLIFTNPQTLSQLSGIEFASLEGSFWSLYVEAVFYLISGALYYFAGRKYCLPGLILPMLIVSAASAIKMLGHPAFADIISKFGFIHYSWFMIGCLVYERLHNRDNFIHYALTLLAILINSGYYIKNGGGFALIPPLVALALFVVSFYSNLVERVLSVKFLTSIGFASYALYLIHENMMVSMLIKISTVVKSDDIMIFMPIPVVTIIYFIARWITQYAEPALKSVLQPQRKQTQAE